MTAQLSVDSVRSGYDGIEVIHGVSFDVDAGESVCLLGRNGMGKTTLLKTIMNVVTPTAGTVTFEGEDLTHQPTYTRVHHDIGYVPQYGGLFPSLTVRENLEVSKVDGGLTDADYESIDDVFPAVESILENQAGNLSGGERKMVKLSKALINEPELLLLDEITEGLQPSLVTQLSETLTAINEDLGVTVFLVEQNVPLCSEVGDRFLFMEGGQIAAETDDPVLERDDLITRYIGAYHESVA